MINKRSINCFLLLQRRLCWLYTTKIMARKSKQFNWHIDYIIDRFVHFVSFFKYLENIFFKTQVTWFCFIYKTWLATNLLYNFTPSIEQTTITNQVAKVQRNFRLKINTSKINNRTRDFDRSHALLKTFEQRIVFFFFYGRKSNREGRKGLKYPNVLTFQHNPLIVVLTVSSFRRTLGNALITSFNEENGDLKLVAKPAIRLPSEETRAQIFSRHFIFL